MTPRFNKLLARCPTDGFPQWKLELDSYAVIYTTAPLDYIRMIEAVNNALNVPQG